MKYKRILVGSISDWYTSTIVQDLEDLGYTVTRFSVDDNRINKVLDTILKMLESVLLKVGLVYYNNVGTLLRFILFDFFFSRKLQEYEGVIVWSGMSLLSLRRANEYGVRSILFLGSENIEKLYSRCSYRKGPVFRLYLKRYWSELNRCDNVLCESSFVMESFSDEIAKKTLTYQPTYNRTVTRKIYMSHDANVLNIALVGLSKLKGAEMFNRFLQVTKISGLKFKLYNSCETDDHRVENIPNLSKKDFLDSLSKNDIYLNLTLSDGGPRAMFEAMSLGLIVISTKYCAAPEHISNGHNGYLINNESDLEEVFQELVSNKQLRVNLSRNTLNYVEGNLSNVNSKSLKNVLIHASWIR